VRLQLDLASQLPQVEGDSVQLQQVVINLLINGMQAMDAQGGGELGLRTFVQDGAVHLAVSDSGPGIAPEHSGKLFDAFFSTRNDGMGMGLAICRSIVESHGGRIAAVPKEGRGACLQCCFPLHMMEAA
jgi:signal transduction histidine kinase